MTLETIALLVIALLNAFTALMAWRTRGEMKVLEQNTNSIKDALVASTAKASRAQGRKEGIDSVT